jgi:L-fuconolactonase
VRIVDSHCHAALGWYEPIEVLLSQMDRNGVELAALIQINGQSDNSYQAECVRRYPDRLRSVVIVDTSSPDAPSELERLVAEGAMIRWRSGARRPSSGSRSALAAVVTRSRTTPSPMCSRRARPFRS